MPIYEYECAGCARVSSHVVMGSNRKQRVTCPHCGSVRTRRVMSGEKFESTV
ncbi:MAG: zinc ribbon domain-containing protein [Candidatus Binatales bacterium]